MTTPQPSQAALDDTLARTRPLPLVPPGAVPAVPAGYEPSDPGTRNKRLRHVPRHLEAEGRRALGNLAERGTRLREELGEFAPGAWQAEQLARDLETVAATKARLQALLAYHEEKEDILLHDALVLLEQAHREYAYWSARRASVALAYQPLAEFIAARNGAIAQGVARARRQRRADAAVPGTV